MNEGRREDEYIICNIKQKSRVKLPLFVPSHAMRAPCSFEKSMGEVGVGVGDGAGRGVVE